MTSQKTKKQQQLECRRHRVLALLAEDYNQNEISNILQVSPAPISKVVAQLKDQSRSLLRIHLKLSFPLEYQQALINLKSIRREGTEMLKKPNTDDRLKICLFLVIKDITESILSLVSKGVEIDDAVTLMEEKSADATEQIGNIKREVEEKEEEQQEKRQQHHQQKEREMEDPAIFWESTKDIQREACIKVDQVQSYLKQTTKKAKEGVNNNNTLNNSNQSHYGYGTKMSIKDVCYLFR